MKLRLCYRFLAQCSQQCWWVADFLPKCGQISKPFIPSSFPLIATTMGVADANEYHITTLQRNLQNTIINIIIIVIITIIIIYIFCKYANTAWRQLCVQEIDHESDTFVLQNSYLEHRHLILNFYWNLSFCPILVKLHWKKKTSWFVSAKYLWCLNLWKVHAGQPKISWRLWSSSSSVFPS